MKKSTKTVTTPASPAPVPAKKAKVAVKSIAAKVPTPAKVPALVVTKAPAPAKAPAPVKVAEKPVKAAAKKPAKAPVKVVAETPAPAPAPIPAPAAPVVAAAPAPAKAPVVTTVTAQIDVGFGNSLFIRGEGPGLSWETGKLLDCVDDDKWVLTVSDAQHPLVFKFLVNDLTWSTGEDYSVEPGSSVVLTPAF